MAPTLQAAATTFKKRIEIHRKNKPETENLKKWAYITIRPNGNGKYIGRVPDAVEISISVTVGESRHIHIGVEPSRFDGPSNGASCLETNEGINIVGTSCRFGFYNYYLRQGRVRLVGNYRNLNNN